MEEMRAHLKGELVRFEVVPRVLAQALDQLGGLAQGVLRLGKRLPVGVWVLLLVLFLCGRLRQQLNRYQDPTSQTDSVR